jgi:peptidoglycan/LPS O-acetylase OafA/YrhL
MCPRSASLTGVSSPLNESVAPSAIQTGQRMLFLDALRAFASVVILLHHFALYPPLCENAEALIGSMLDWFRDHGRMTQVFFVVGGYVMARTMSARTWSVPAMGLFVVHRYCRLGIPYLAAIVLAILACALGREWLPVDVIGTPPTVLQFVAHLFFLQEFLGYEHLSAGLWFVCINFQLVLIYVFMLYLRDALPHWFRSNVNGTFTNVPMIAGWGISVISLFIFNRDSSWDSWVIYFFPYFFMGIAIHHALLNKRFEIGFWLYVLLFVAALAFDWRWRLVSAVVIGLLLFGTVKSGLATSWPKSRLVAKLGSVSYSLFLVHFPVLVMIATVWEKLGWTSPSLAVTGLLTALLASIATSLVFHRYIELPALGLFRKRGSEKP